MSDANDVERALPDSHEHNLSDDEPTTPADGADATDTQTQDDRDDPLSDPKVKAGYASRYREELYQELLRFALGRPVRVELEELVHHKAGIAKQLIAEEPSLAFKMDALLEKVDQECRGAQNKGDLPPI